MSIVPLSLVLYRLFSNLPRSLPAPSPIFALSLTFSPFLLSSLSLSSCFSLSPAFLSHKRKVALSSPSYKVLPPINRFEGPKKLSDRHKTHFFVEEEEEEEKGNVDSIGIFREPVKRIKLTP